MFLTIFSNAINLGINPGKIDSIRIQDRTQDRHTPLNPEICLNDNDIEKLKLGEQKSKFCDYIVEIYTNHDKNRLIELIQSRNGRDYCRKILDLLLSKKLTPNDFTLNEQKMSNFKKKLLSVSKGKNDINNILLLSKGLLECLIFINDNYNEIYKILSNETYFGISEINLLIPDKNDNIDNICLYLSKIINLSKYNYHSPIFNYNELFGNLISFYSSKSLAELCKLLNILNLFGSCYVKQETIEKYYDKIHSKGLNLIKKMNIEEIIFFIKSQDVYYYQENFRKSKKRDPAIFNYIKITDEDNNYSKYINLIKEYKIMNIFTGINTTNEEELYKILLSQMKKIKDFQSIFELFPKETISKKFNLLINEKMISLKFTALNNKDNIQIIFSIFDNWLIINHYNSLNLETITNQIEMDYGFTNKYYEYLLVNPKMIQILDIIKGKISNFFISQYNMGNLPSDYIVSTLLSLKDIKLTSIFLDELEKNIITEEDFYKNEITLNFKLFKSFLEKYHLIIKNKEIYKGEYLVKIGEIKSKIYNDLKTNDIEYEKIHNLITPKSGKIFLEKMKVVIQDNKEATNLYNNLKNNVEKCRQKFDELNNFIDFFSTFYKESQKDLLEIIQEKIIENKKKKISELLKIQNFLSDVTAFNYEEIKEKSKNIKYKNSIFFMAIYSKKEELERNEKNEEKLLNETITSFKETFKKIINQKETKEPFFKIENHEEILEQLSNPNNDLQAEMEFLKEEFSDLNKDNYIRYNLRTDLNNFSKKYNLLKLTKGIITFIRGFSQFRNIEITDFMNSLEETVESLNSDEVSSGQIAKAITFLRELNCDINNQISINYFYELLSDKKESILFIKTLIDSNMDIRSLNEFIDESASELQASDIDNLIYVFTFYEKIIDNKKITSDRELIDIFNEEYIKDNDIAVHMQEYLNTYGDLIQLYKSFDDNPESAVETVENILKKSTLLFFIEKKTNSFTFTINKLKDNDLEELRNKILLTNSEKLKYENKDNKNDKSKITFEYLNLIDNIKQLNKTLNNLVKSGYPDLPNLSLLIIDSQAKDKNNRNLEKLIKEYLDINKHYQKSIKNGYDKYPLLRLFYGEQFIKLYQKIRDPLNNNIEHLLNSVTLNKLNATEIEYKYDENINILENINAYLNNLFEKNSIDINDIFKTNHISDRINLEPGLYRKVKYGDNNTILNNVMNIYINITNNLPVINTLLICNEETTIQKIKSFLYRALLCDKPILFLITNMELLNLSTTRNLIKTIKFILKNLKANNKKVNSYILFIYEKKNSGLVRELDLIIPEKNILDDIFLEEPEKTIDAFSKTELYCSKYSGYGKTTEIKYKVRNKGDKYKYFYFPLGGSFNRDYVMDNLIEKKLDLKQGNLLYLHLDLSETDNSDLMNEILFKLIILRYIDSNERIYYLGYDINIIIEIPNGFVKFDTKYKLLNKFKKVYIEKLKPLRLEENIKVIEDSPISIVAEVLTLYDSKEIATKNIKLKEKIKMSAEECEKIINKYFNVKNQNYYQKINFIKILSVQFVKFTKSFYFYYDKFSLIKEVMQKARLIIISNFIKLTEIFTRSPFDSVLTMQEKSLEIMGNIDNKQAVEEGLNALANEKLKQEIFSFNKIDPSLVFFSKDGSSYSIISDNDKNKNNYNALKLLWNSQNAELFNLAREGGKKIKDIINVKNLENMKDLTNYKNMTHKNFLQEIQNIFSLEEFKIEEIQKWCDELGNYIFVSDNFIKMARILLNIEAKIPVILMGETGVGKTKLLEMLAKLHGKGEVNWEKLNIDAGITDKDIIDFIKNIEHKVESEGKQKEKIWIFFDEINTCNSLGLITEIMCNHTYLGKKINDNFIFLGACNPYRVLTKAMRQSGLVYYNLEEKNKLNNLVYTVNPLPYSLLNFIFDFGSLKEEDEKKYIINSIKSMISKFQDKKIITDIDKNSLNGLIKEIYESITICHKFLRNNYDESVVSLREIRRFGVFFEYFIKYFKSSLNLHSTNTIMKYSLNMTLYLCYYLRINEKKIRNQLAEKLDPIFYDNIKKDNNFTRFPKFELKKLTKLMLIEKGIALNRALKENLYTYYTCIEANIPLIIIGKPGTGKSLSFQILYNTLKGEHSEEVFFRDKGKLYRYYYQGSETSTSKGIKKVFDRALKEKKANKNNNRITLVFFDEMGLAERSSNNPLKIMHYLLEQDGDKSVPFLGISNWRLDAAKINRALNLSITDYDETDLKETASSIAEALDFQLSKSYSELFDILASTYYEYMLLCKENNIKENKDFHGNRDFYALIKIAMKELIEKKNELNGNEIKILTEICIRSLNRNFGGLENSNSKIIKIFEKKYAHKINGIIEIEKNFSVLDGIKKNILEPDNRYLMLISEGNDASDIVKYLLKSLNKNYIELIGSQYSIDKKSGRYSEEILNKIKYIMESPNILILKDLDVVYPSLYDLFNQNFITSGQKKFVRIAFEYAKVSSQVNQDFHVIVIINKIQIQQLKLDPPFLNRFEKHIINFSMLLDEIDKEIVDKLYNYIRLISSFNDNEKDLKIDLDKLLINCERHHIEGLVFKIKNDLMKAKNEEEKKNLEGPKYESFMINEALKRIVPTFCQDIIASMKYSNMYQKDNNLYQLILNYYKESNKINFEEFFSNITFRKNIIFTFSKITDNLFENNKTIKNKYGEFNSDSTLIEMIESIQSENDLIFLLKTFTSSENKYLLTLKFTEKELDKLNSINYLINNYEKENPKLKEKLIIFLIHKQRLSRTKEHILILKPDLIPFINDEFYQIFIDNLQGEKNSIMELINNKNEATLAKEYINNSEFLEKKLFKISNYFKYNILFETEKLNKKNVNLFLTEHILTNKRIKELILNNLQKQGEFVQGIIKDIFINDIVVINDIDFFEIINSKLSIYFCGYLLNILNHSIEKDILNQLLINENIDIILENDSFNNMVNTIFNETKFSKKLNKILNGNDIKIYNALMLPGCRRFLNELKNYYSKEILERYLNNENMMRKDYKTEKKIDEVAKKYEDESYQLEENMKNEINKKNIFKEIFHQNNEEFKKLIFEDYLINYLINNLEVQNIDYITNQKLLHFLKFIIKKKFSENNSYEYEFRYNIDEFARIILFIEGYKKEINNLLNIFANVQKYCSDIDERMKNILNEGKIKLEQSGRNKSYIRKVNQNFYYILESFIKAILSFSIELLKADNAKFYNYFYELQPIEANFQNINKKLYLYSKEIYNIRTIIKIEEAFKHNQEIFENNYEKIMNILFQQSILLYDGKNKNLYENIVKLIKFIDDNLNDKEEEYINLLYFIYRQQYKNIFDEEFRKNLVEDLLKNKLLLKKSKTFLSDLLKELKPENYDPNNKKNQTKELLINNFMNFSIKKLNKYNKIFEICKNIDSPEFNEILLYFFEEQCQSYFLNILKNNGNIYTEKTCSELLLDISFEYLKIAIENFYNQSKKNDNNLLKFYAIAYIKTYFHFYVYIQYKEFDKCNFEEINKLLYKDEREQENQLMTNIRNIRNIYIWRVYSKHFQSFEQLKIHHHFKELPNIKEFNNYLSKDNKNTKYIFKESFISPNYCQKYSIMVHDLEETKSLNFDEINQNFDLFYSALVNKVISFKYGDNDDIEKINEKMKQIYNISKDKIKFTQEGKILFEYLLDPQLFKNNISDIISDTPLTKNDFEILLYSFRIILNLQLNNENIFYNHILKKDAFQFIKNNFIPGSFPKLNEFMKSYSKLYEKFKQKILMGYYICKDCGFLYEVKPCTFPTVTSLCPKGHIIGGKKHILAKKDIRVFNDYSEYNNLYTKWAKNNKDNQSWFNSFEKADLKEYKEKYLDKHKIEPQKGIVNDFEINEFENLSFIRNMDIITFRLLNFILYSFLLGSFILKNLSKDEASNYLVENLFPHTLFGIIKKNWELLDISLKKKGIEKIQTFLNMAFDKIIELIQNLNTSDSIDKLINFESKVNDYIIDTIFNKENIDKMNKDYQNINNDIIATSPDNIKEIILEYYEPSFYDQKLYPDIQYYYASKIYAYDTFVEKFKSLNENKNKYALINLLINKDEDILKNATKLKYLNSINNLSNILLGIYSYKISRDEAKTKILRNELKYIEEIFGQNESFENNFITPFIESWDKIKEKCTQYRCYNLVDKEPLNLKIGSYLSYFLADDGERLGGMFIASAYENFINWQNSFINSIIDKNKMSGTLNSYISQLEQEINVQDAKEDDILLIDEKCYEFLDELIHIYSMRNIIEKGNKINYKNYNDIEYDYEFIENELAKEILLGKKKFKNYIKFVTYLYEGFRGGNSTILFTYNEKYPFRELKKIEKETLNIFINENKNKGIYNDIFSSLQILMNEIIKENYDSNKSIYEIIESLPKFVVINKQLVKLLKDKYEFDINHELNLFTIDCLVPFFEYFETLCWKEIKESILTDYKNLLTDEIRKHILNYFEKNNSHESLINKRNLTKALRKLLSRSIAGQKEAIDINKDEKLINYINQEYIWDKKTFENPNFEDEMSKIFVDNILIKHAFEIFNLLDGDNMSIYENEKESVKMQNQNIFEDNKVNQEKKDNNNNNSDESDEGESLEVS